MLKPASSAIARLVRQTLPKPVLAGQWNVRVVERLEDVGAELFAGIVYVHRTWPETVLKAQLAHVTGHYPLVVEPSQKVDTALLGRGWPSTRAKQVFVSRAITLELSFLRGQFTGVLTVGEAFIVWAADGNERYADRDCNRAIEEVTKAVRSSARQHANDLTNLHDLARQFLRAVDTRYFFDTGRLVPLKAYKPLLPASSLHALQRYHARHIHPRRGVPLRMIQSQCFEAIGGMQENIIHNLLHQLAMDFSKLQPITEETIAFRFKYGADLAVKEWRRGLRKSA
jgi:hypothetical protein